MTIHIMLGLETWGTEPGCDIRSIGACVFDPVTGWVGPIADNEFYIACDNPIVADHNGYGDPPIRKYPLTRDPATVQWWSEQSDAAQAAFADPVDLRVALERFGRWLRAFHMNDAIQLVSCGKCNRAIQKQDYQCPYCDTYQQPLANLAIWSHGAAFDPPILAAAAYRAVGLPVPWHDRAPRDTRTAFDMAGIDDHSAWLAQTPGPLGIPHHALDDAICQARAVCAAWAKNRTETIDADGQRWSMIDTSNLA